MSAAQEGRLPPDAAQQIRLFDPSAPAEELAALGITPIAPGAGEDLQRELASELADPAEVTALSSAEATAAGELTLPQFHARHFLPWREAGIAAGRVKRTSFSTECTHIRRYAEWDGHATRRPAAWPAGLPWEGLPLRYLTPKWCRQFLLHCAGELAWAESTTLSCWTSLRTVLNHARKLGVTESVPSLPKLREELRAATGEDEDEAVLTYSDEQLGALCAAIDPVVAAALEDRTIRTRSPKQLKSTARSIARELKAALVLGANCGPRPADLFAMEFERHVKLDAAPPAVVYRAAKTGKSHHVPLAGVTIERLQRLRKAHGQFARIDTYLFPHLTSPKSNRPMHSDHYRRTVQLLRRALTAIGLDESLYQKPWHSLRKSCTTRFNAHGIATGLGSVGKLITHGKDSDVASQSYDNPLPTILKAVETIDWPPEFFAAVERG